MDYKATYDRLIESRRGRRRDGYLEAHHILPRFAGGGDDQSNLVELTAREHFVAHLLLMKIYSNTPLAPKAASSLGMFFMVCKRATPRQQDLREKYNAKSYSWARIAVNTILSEAAKGKIVVRDGVTRALIGKVSTSHPKVLSGEWIHHAKGRKYTIEESMKKPDYSGSLNPNYKQLTPEVEKVLREVGYELFCKDRYVNTSQFLDRANAHLVPKVFQRSISIGFIISKYGSWRGFVDALGSAYNVHIPSHKPKAEKKVEPIEDTVEVKPRKPKRKLEQIMAEVFGEEWSSKYEMWKCLTTPSEAKRLCKIKLVELFGQQGSWMYEQLTSSRGISKEYLISKYGEEAGADEYAKLKSRRQQETTVEYKITKHGAEKAHRMISERLIRNTANGQKLQKHLHKVKHDKNSENQG